LVVFRWLRAVGAFSVDFIVGDDWTVAASIAVALVVTWALVARGVPAWWLLPVTVLTVTTTSLRRTVRRNRR
jgi:hypothetical protein